MLLLLLLLLFQGNKRVSGKYPVAAAGRLGRYELQGWGGKVWVLVPEVV